MNKGYTLVEVLAVIALLSLVTSLVVINTNRYANIRKEQDFNNIKEIIVDNAKTLVSTDSVISMKVNDKLLSLENDENYTSDISCKIQYKVLVNKRLMDKDTKNPITNQLLDDDSYVKITLNEQKNDYIYEYIYSEYDDTIENCLE